MGRPTKLTDDRLARLTYAISRGSSYVVACKYAGITYQTLRNWLEAGESAREGSPARAVLDAVNQAEGNAVVKWLDRIEQAAEDGEWQAAAWKLERRYPEDYGRKIVDQRHSGRIDYSKLSDDELRNIIES